MRDLTLHTTGCLPVGLSTTNRQTRRCERFSAAISFRRNLPNRPLGPKLFLVLIHSLRRQVLGRKEAYLIALGLYVLGYIIVASSPDIYAYGVGNSIYVLGITGTSLSFCRPDPGGSLSPRLRSYADSSINLLRSLPPASNYHRRCLVAPKSTLLVHFPLHSGFVTFLSSFLGPAAPAATVVILPLLTFGIYRRNDQRLDVRNDRSRNHRREPRQLAMGNRNVAQSVATSFLTLPQHCIAFGSSGNQG